jgi:hypothetical protein
MQKEIDPLHLKLVQQNIHVYLIVPVGYCFEQLYSTLVVRARQAYYYA